MDALEGGGAHEDGDAHDRADAHGVENTHGTRASKDGIDAASTGVQAGGHGELAWTVPKADPLALVSVKAQDLDGARISRRWSLKGC